MLRELIDAARDWVVVVPRRWRRGAVGVAVLLVTLAVVRSAALQDDGADGPGPNAAFRRPEDTTRSAVMLRQNGRAVLGVLHTNDGAAAAALSYLGQRDLLKTGATSSAVAAEVGSELALGGHDIGDRPASIPDRAADVNPEGMLASRQGTLRWLTVPLAYRVVSYRPGRARVRLFSAALNVAATVDQGPAAIAFSLRDMALDWSNGAWRIRSVIDTRDQPTPGFVAATYSDHDTDQLPIRDRLIPSNRSGSTGLFDWLSGAPTALVGPRAMGPVRGRAGAAPGAPRNLLTAIASGYAAATAQSFDPRNERWSTATPIASRPTDCPSAAGDETRCFEVLSLAATVRGRGLVIVTLQLAGLAVSSRDGVGGSVKFDLPPGRQDLVLGGVLRIASAGLPEARTTNAAWRRSVLPLSPTYPARPR